jgi:hypothetical protein
MGESWGTLPGSSVIRLHRQQGFYVDCLRAYRVRIDGNPAGKIAQGETKDFLVPSGEHRVRLAIDRFWTSREVALQLREGEVAEFTCHPAWVITAMALMLACPRRYISLAGPGATNRA